MTDEERVCEILARCREAERGETIDPDAIVRANPELAEMLEARFEALRVLDRAYPSRQEASEGSSAGEDLVGKLLGPYRLLEPIGSGGMRSVWRAVVEGKAAGLEPGQVVALKLLHPQLFRTPGFFKRFLREVQVGKAVVHENVVRTLDADEVWIDARSHHFLVMELVEGQTLRGLLREMQKVPEDLCRHIGREVAKGLAAIHAQGIVHRDVKPENVLVTEEHGVKVMDLGVARLADEAVRLSQTGAFVGSIQYAAPEQFARGGVDVDARADLHALGLVLYELACGVNPYLADGVPQIVGKVLHQEPRRLGEVDPQISPYFEEVVHCLLEKDREKRFASAQELAEILEAGPEHAWWKGRATRRTPRRIRVPREAAVHGRGAELARLRSLFERRRAEKSGLPGPATGVLRKGAGVVGLAGERKSTAIPLPVSALLRRARNAKSPKDRHDTAYFAWEASVVLAVAARPPADLSALARPSVGAWVAALQARAERHAEPPLLAAFALFSEVGANRKASPKSVSARELLDALPAYRNQVIGHGSTRAAEFYDQASPVLLDGLTAAWEQGFFLRGQERLTYVEAVEIDPSGLRRARLLDLTGTQGEVVDPRGTPDVPDSVLPRRAYLRAGTEFRPLHPWVLCREEEARERVYLFSSLTHHAKYLDYVSGETLAGADLEAAFPGTEAEAFALLHQRMGEAPKEEPEDADRLGDYRILGKLGEGGMGIVYLARQESLERLVALKMLPPGIADDPVAVARFDREVAALSRCEHKNVVKILASGVARGRRYYAMEYVEGTDLGRISTALKENGDLTTAVSSAWERFREERSDLFEHVPEVQQAKAAPVKSGRGEIEQLTVAFRDAAQGLHHLHEAGVVHRDVKPGNLMLTAADQRVVVMDLGLAAVTGASRSITRDKGQILGTLRYMAPEQLQRNLLSIDRRADVYSLGATFYAFTGRPLLDGDTEARLIEQILRETPPAAKNANPRLPSDLSTVLGKATDKDPKLRYETAEDLAKDLDLFLEGRPISARPPTLRYVLGLAIRRNKPLAATVAASVLVMVVGSVLFIGGLDDRRREAERETQRAEQQAGRANRERDEKARALVDVLRLADAKRVRDLVDEADTLWPVHADRAQAMADWIDRAKDALENRSVHEESLTRLRAEALPYSDQDRARDHAGDAEKIGALRVRLKDAHRTNELRPAGASGDAATPDVAALKAEFKRLQSELATRITWSFSDSSSAWKHQVLTGLLAALDGLQDPKDPSQGLLGRIEARHREAVSLGKRSIEDHADAWKRATEAIALSSRYGGLKVAPQLGLIPLGADPASGLHEFAHLGSGSIPARDPATNRLVFAEDAAIVLVLIPGGTFNMGGQRTDPSAPNYDPESEANEGPVHEVTISPYFLAKHECTQAQWAELTGGERPSTYRAGTVFNERATTPRNPVEGLSWEDEMRWLPRRGLTLPTEAQWERAARAGTDTPWSFGAEVGELGVFGNVADAYMKANGGPPSWAYTVVVNDGQTVHAPVGSYRPNAFGLYDVHGNVLEWCRDEYGPYGAAAAHDPFRDGPGTHVYRGGGWPSTAPFTRSAVRGKDFSGFRSDDQGCRPARPLTPD